MILNAVENRNRDFVAAAKSSDWLRIAGITDTIYVRLFSVHMQ